MPSPLETARVIYHFARVRYRHFDDRAALLRLQRRQVARHVAWVLAHSRFYRAWSGGRDAADWERFPVINKAIMMDNFDALNTAGVRLQHALRVALQAERDRDFSPMLDGLTVGLSSGTSGSRGVFLVSHAERLRWMGVAVAKLLPHDVSPLAPQRIAFFLRANSNLYQTLNRGRFTFQYFDMARPPAEHIAPLNALAPTILVGPPSMLRFLAEHAALTIAPRKVIAGAEVLDPLDAEVIGARFGEPVHQVYQATEGFLASTCRYGTLHLHEDLVAFQQEPLPDDPTGRKFTPIITDFNRTTQPIIRYRLNDVLTLRAEPCPCGSVMTALDQIEGRQDDLFYLPNGRVIFPDFIRRAVIRAEGVTAYQVEQTAPDAVTVYVAPPEVFGAVRGHLAGVLGEEVALSYGGPPDDAPSVTKLKRVRRGF